MKELDKYIISQRDAKRKICLAIRNKFRQRKLKGEICEFIRPSNILLYGQSGSGKTEVGSLNTRSSDNLLGSTQLLSSK